MATKTPTNPSSSNPSTPSGKRSQRWIWVGVAAVAVLAATAAMLFSSDETATEVIQTRPVTLSGTPLPELADSGADPAIGTPAPTLSGSDFDGRVVKVDPSKGPVMLVFLAHWCPHCNRELPQLVAYGSRSDLPEGLQMIAVSTAVAAERDNYPPSEWIDSRGWENPVIADDEDFDAARAFGLSGFPYTVLISTDGTVADRWSGELGQEAIAQRVAAAFG
jgi:thiol-disulfide isomerase/thioredoxin